MPANTGSVIGNGGTIGTNNSALEAMKHYDDANIKDLAYDIGVDPTALKKKLQTMCNPTGISEGSYF